MTSPACVYIPRFKQILADIIHIFVDCGEYADISAAAMKARKRFLLRVSKIKMFFFFSM